MGVGYRRQWMRPEGIDRDSGIHKLTVDLPADIAVYLRTRAFKLNWSQGKLLAELIEKDRGYTGGADMNIGRSLETAELVERG
jgi:hypothetical protein